MSEHIDATGVIERLEAFEDRLSVQLDALYCGVEGPDSDGDYTIHVNGELYPASGTGIEGDIELVLAVYDGMGRVVDTSSDFLHSDQFFGFHTFSFTLFSKIGRPSRIRLYPKPL